jgi:hypothetical protein
LVNVEILKDEIAVSYPPAPAGRVAVDAPHMGADPHHQTTILARQVVSLG